MKTKFKIIFSIIMLFTIMLLTSCKMNSAENGLDLYKENLSSLYEGKDINYDSGYFRIPLIGIKSINNPKWKLIYYFNYIQNIAYVAIINFLMLSLNFKFIKSKFIAFSKDIHRMLKFFIV